MPSADWFDVVRKGNAWHGPREFPKPSRWVTHARPVSWFVRLVRRLRGQ